MMMIMMLVAVVKHGRGRGEDGPNGTMIEIPCQPYTCTFRFFWIYLCKADWLVVLLFQSLFFPFQGWLDLVSSYLLFLISFIESWMCWWSPSFFLLFYINDLHFRVDGLFKLVTFSFSFFLIIISFLFLYILFLLLSVVVVVPFFYVDPNPCIRFFFPLSSISL